MGEDKKMKRKDRIYFRLKMKKPKKIKKSKEENLFLKDKDEEFIF